ncbi:MAG: hypothetical protein HC817_11600 [Saprospiraceae bacterium]|nr:hypothetical protein [Saprospiraceae bacterium]
MPGEKTTITVKTFREKPVPKAALPTSWILFQKTAQKILKKPYKMSDKLKTKIQAQKVHLSVAVSGLKLVFLARAAMRIEQRRLQQSGRQIRAAYQNRWKNTPIRPTQAVN